jgi:hypothetical protein
MELVYGAVPEVRVSKGPRSCAGSPMPRKVGEQSSRKERKKKSKSPVSQEQDAWVTNKEKNQKLPPEWK